MILLPDIRAQLAAALSQVYTPSCPLNCWEWCEKNIILSPEESRDHHGPYDSSLTPFVRRVMEFVTSSDEDELIIMKSAQLGFTLAYLLIIAYLAATRATHVIFAMDSAKEARNISARLQRILEQNPATAGVFTEDPDDVTTLTLRLRGMIIWLIGSGSAGAYANKSAGLMILDELDKHAPAPGGEANTIDLARNRGKKVQGSKLIAGGTPVEWDGETNQNYLTGSREELQCPCPHCGHYQAFRWEQMRFEHCKTLDGEWDYERLRNETYYECEMVGCAQQIREEHKPAMLRRAKWVRTNVGKDEWKAYPRRASIHINDLYDTLNPEKTSWGALAVKWIGAQGNSSKMIDFFNSTLGRPKKESKMELKEGDIYKLCAGYDHGCMPVSPARDPRDGAPLILMGVDLQATMAKYVKVGYTVKGEAWLIDYGTCGANLTEIMAIGDQPIFVGKTYPDPKAMQEVLDESIATGQPYDKLLAERFPGEWLRVTMGFVDEGNGDDIFKVRDFCQSTRDPVTGVPRFFPCKGVDWTHVKGIFEEIPDRFRTSDGETITVYHLADATLKRELYIDRIAEWERIRRKQSLTPALHLPARPDKEFVDELTQEKRGPVMKKGKIVMVWLDPKGPNDFGDALKYTLGLWHVVKGQFTHDPAAQPAAA